MILFELTREDHPVYQHYSFLRSIISASLEMGKPFLSQHVLKALNFHAITCLHSYAGEYRPCPVKVGEHHPPEHYRVPALMDDLINTVNRTWDQTDPVLLATYVLWRVNNIHPFINGNGRTARAACYFILCLAAGGWLRGDPILPELIIQNHNEYCEHLQIAHDAFAVGVIYLDPLHAYVSRLLDQQLKSAV